MTTEPDLFELLYVSCIAPSTDVRAVGQIARDARASNAMNGITGLLVFDGQRFAQHLEGYAHVVRQLFERIEADSRHMQVQLLQQCASTQRKFQRFSMGYASLGDVEPLQSLELQEGEGARRAFAEMLPLIDMEP
ncbi:BLUF domain-containing protein [Variovorax sp. H27-G14]|uniref:BLUF domain-containing protein n=1 Tax=Variovorax sp. H27-G14 TaxID=3111914 RepID=UPI0038FC4FCE